MDVHSIRCASAEKINTVLLRKDISADQEEFGSKLEYAGSWIDN